MRLILMIYLLLKSAFIREFTWMDIGIAQALCGTTKPRMLWDTDLLRHPDWLQMIGRMEQEAVLTEAWGLFTWELSEQIYELVGKPGEP